LTAVAPESFEKAWGYLVSGNSHGRGGPREPHLDSLRRYRYILCAFLLEYCGFPVFNGGSVSGLRINISKLSEGIHHRSLEAEPGEIGLDGRFNAAVRIHAELEKGPKQLLLSVQVSAAGAFTCDRCLDDYTREVTAKYVIVYMFGTNKEGDRQDKEVAFIHPDTSFIDIGEDVRQYTTLAVPQKLLCREDCRGLCPRCGTNRNRAACQHAEDEVDSRWEGLRQFLQN